jgi:hypothetical protein
MISTLKSRLLLSGPMRSLGTGTALVLLLTSSPAFAATELVMNGDFSINSGNGLLGYNTSVADWMVPTTPPGATSQPNSYWFVFNADSGTTSGTSADNSGAPGFRFDGFDQTVRLWGPGNPSGMVGPGTPGVSGPVGGTPNGLTLSPNGGAFVGSDPAFPTNSPMTQTLNGLAPGVPVIVTFDWAVAQQFRFNAPDGLDAGWDVTLGTGPGAQTDTTGTVHIPNMGFSGWMPASFTFTPTSSSETLSFKSIGSPIEALPPFALLDSVSAREVPEPSTWVIMALGFAGLAYVGFRSNRRQPAWSD